MSVQEYLDKHRLSQRIEESVNAAVRAKADDLVLFVSDYLRKLIPPSILSITAREILDSSGGPALEVDLFTSRGSFRASTTLSDAGTQAKPFSQDRGLAAVAMVKDVIAPAIVGKDPREQSEVDDLILSSVGSAGSTQSGATLAVSLAVCKAGAAHTEETLSSYLASLAKNDKLRFPVPAFTLLSRSKASKQELTILPVGAETILQAVKMGCQTCQCFTELVRERYGDAACAPCAGGGPTPTFRSHLEGVQVAVEAIKRAGYEGHMKIGMDAGAAETCNDSGLYELNPRGSEPGAAQKRSGGELLEAYRQMCAEFPVASISGAFDPRDAISQRDLTDLAICQVVGEEALSSDPRVVAQTAESGLSNTTVFKMSQMATVSRAVEAVAAALKGGLSVIAGQSGAETGETALADMALGLGMGQIRIGPPTGLLGLHISNQLLRIEEEVGVKPTFASEKWL